MAMTQESLQQFNSLIVRAIEIMKRKKGKGWLRAMRRQLPGGTFSLFLVYIYLSPEEGGPAFDGQPIRDADLADELGHSVSTVRRWRNALAVHGYITQSKTPEGWIVNLKR